MNTVAYLVAHLDTRHSPPVVTAARIYSEPADTLTGAIGPGRWAFTVLKANGNDFRDAIRNLCDGIQQFPQVYGWVEELLDEQSHLWFTGEG